MMYRVIVAREITESCEFTITAENVIDAERQALEAANDESKHHAEWDFQSARDAYVADVEARPDWDKAESNASAIATIELWAAALLGEEWQTIVADISSKPVKRRTAAEQAICAAFCKATAGE